MNKKMETLRNELSQKIEDTKVCLRNEIKDTQIKLKHEFVYRIDNQRKEIIEGLQEIANDVYSRVKQDYIDPLDFRVKHLEELCVSEDEENYEV